MSPIIQALKIADFRNLWLGQIFSQLSVNALVFALMLSVYEKTTSNTAVSLLVLTFGVPALLFGVAAGAFVDHWSKVRVLFFCNLWRSLLIVALMATYKFTAVLYLILTLISAITQFFIPAEVPLIPHLVPKKLLFTANSIFTFSYYTTMIVGFIASGPLIFFFGKSLTFGLIAFFMGLAAYFVRLIELPQAKTSLGWQEILSRIRAYLREGFIFITSRTGIGEAILLFTAAQALVITLAALAPGFAVKVLGIVLTQATVVVMVPAVLGVILASFLLGHAGSSWPQQQLTNIGIIGSGTVLLLVSLFVRLGNAAFLSRGGWVIRLEVAMLLFFLFGVFNAAVVVPVNTFIQKTTKEAIRSRVYGVVAALSGGVSILPVILAGRSADTVGVGKTIFFMAIIIFCFGIYRVVRAGYTLKVKSEA